MFVSLAGYAVDMRPLRVHVPAFWRATSEVWTVSLKAGLYTYKAVERARRVDRHTGTQWLAYLSDVYLRAGRLDDAPTMAERLLALGRERRKRSTEARGWHLFGEIAIQCESPHAEEAVAPYRQGSSP